MTQVQFRTHNCGEINDQIIEKFRVAYEIGESANSIGNRLKKIEEGKDV